ncbi:MAG: biotin--[acetyl-CoA-carboxylase] ligase [Saprospiraceae bacterium]|nr:biotin--[acetyl-CoA-carboxylase] ligase [Saprospiraceae bacterium]
MALEHSDSSLFIGNPHIRLNSVGSTNAYAQECISKSNPTEGTVISASFQSDGKGQIGRFWESEMDKNILCSTILRPIFLPPQDQFQLNMAVSLAILDFVSHYIPNERVRIKWPNDIYVNDDKIAGILIQNTLKGKSISSCVVGTGINVNQIQFSSFIPNPTSLCKIMQTEVNIEMAFLKLFEYLTIRYRQLFRGEIESLKNAYLQHLYRINEWWHFEDVNYAVFTGKILGVDEIGQLIVEREDGRQSVFAFREIRFVI